MTDVVRRDFNMAKLRWGIVSAGNISHDFVNAVNNPSGPAHANNVVSVPRSVL